MNADNQNNTRVQDSVGSRSSDNNVFKPSSHQFTGSAPGAVTQNKFQSAANNRPGGKAGRHLQLMANGFSSNQHPIQAAALGDAEQAEAVSQLSSQDNILQRVDDEEEDGFFTRLKKGFKKHGTWVMLIAEGLAHWGVSVGAALSAGGGAFWNIITSICQGVIGASKLARAYFVRRLAYNPLRALPGYFNTLIGVEGGLGAISAIFGGWGVIDKGKDVVLGLVPKIAGFIASAIKVCRGAGGARLTKRQKGVMIVLESLLSIFGNIERIITSADKVFDGLGKVIGGVCSKVVGAVKLGRGAKTYKDGAITISETATDEEQRQYYQHVLDTEDLDGNTRDAITARLRQQGAVALPGAAEAAAAARERGVATE